MPRNGGTASRPQLADLLINGVTGPVLAFIEASNSPFGFSILCYFLPLIILLQINSTLCHFLLQFFFVPLFCLFSISTSFCAPFRRFCRSGYSTLDSFSIRELLLLMKGYLSGYSLLNKESRYRFGIPYVIFWKERMFSHATNQQRQRLHQLQNKVSRVKECHEIFTSCFFFFFLSNSSFWS